MQQIQLIINFMNQQVYNHFTNSHNFISLYAIQYLVFIQKNDNKDINYSSNWLEEIELKFIMSHRNKQVTSNLNLTKDGSKVKITKLQEDIDDLHVTIQSSIPIRPDKQKFNYSKAKGQYERSNYFIEIDDEDFTDIDLTVKVGNQAYTTQIRTKPSYSIGQYHSRSSQSYRLGQNHSTERIKIQDSQQNRNVAYQYATQPAQSHRNQYNISQPYMNSRKHQQTRNIIKIVDGQRQYLQNDKHLQVSKWRTLQNPNNQQQYQRINHTQPFRKQRGEKQFAYLKADHKQQGKIIKNQQAKANGIHENISNTYSTSNEAAGQNASQNAQRYKSGQNSISYFQKNKAHNVSIQAEQIQEHLLTPSNRTPKSQKPKIAEFTTQQKTPSRNYLTYNQQSPVIYPYKEYPSGDEQFSPVFSKSQQNEWKRPKIFKKNQENSQIQQLNDEELENQRKPPLPYSNKNDINQKIPSFKNISYENKKQAVSQSQIVKNNQKQNVQKRGKQYEPIVIPFNKVPNELNKKQMHLTKPTEQDQGRISNETPYINRYKTEYREQKQSDIFSINKRKYLNRLKKQERSKSKSSANRTFSNSRHSLSPECQLVTNRLYKSRTNKQPCPKYLHEQQMMKRIQMKKTLGQYTFIRRYLSDTEIYRILADMQESGIPQKKWPIRLVDIVYQKLRALKNI